MLLAVGNLAAAHELDGLLSESREEAERLAERVVADAVDEVLLLLREPRDACAQWQVREALVVRTRSRGQRRVAVGVVAEVEGHPAVTRKDTGVPDGPLREPGHGHENTGDADGQGGRVQDQGACWQSVAHPPGEQPARGRDQEDQERGAREHAQTGADPQHEGEPRHPARTR